jgi:hypothetical protein
VATPRQCFASVEAAFDLVPAPVRDRVEGGSRW